MSLLESVNFFGKGKKVSTAEKALETKTLETKRWVPAEKKTENGGGGMTIAEFSSRREKAIDAIEGGITTETERAVKQETGDLSVMNDENYRLKNKRTEDWLKNEIARIIDNQLSGGVLGSLQLSEQKSALMSCIQGIPPMAHHLFKDAVISWEEKRKKKEGYIISSLPKAS